MICSSDGLAFLRHLSSLLKIFLERFHRSWHSERVSLAFPCHDFWSTIENLGLFAFGAC